MSKLKRFVSLCFKIPNLFFFLENNLFPKENSSYNSLNNSKMLNFNRTLFIPKENLHLSVSYFLYSEQKLIKSFFNFNNINIRNAHNKTRVPIFLLVSLQTLRRRLKKSAFMNDTLEFASREGGEGRRKVFEMKPLFHNNNPNGIRYTYTGVCL